MNAKKIFLLVMLTRVFLCHASMAVTDFSDAAEKSGDSYSCLESTYVVHPSGITVYEAPSTRSKEIIQLPPDTQVLLMSLNGPSSRVKKWWNYGWSEDGDEAYLDSNWAAILLPPDLRKNGSMIGWVESADLMWWSPSDKFSTEKWTAEIFKSYLMNNLWYVTFESDDDDDEFDIEGGICVFDEKEASVFYYENGRRQSEKTPYSVTSKNSLVLDGDMKKNLEIGRYEFSFVDSDCRFIFRKINLGSLDYIPEYSNDPKKKEQARALVYKASKKYFRMYTADYYNKRSIMGYALDKDDEGLGLLALICGVKKDISDSNYDLKEFKRYWGKIICGCEESVKGGVYEFRPRDQKPVYLFKGNNYLTSDRLRLRKDKDVSSEVIDTMETGTEVKLLEFGSPDIIDGLAGYWVLVQVKGSKKKGWCFGGYLQEKN